MNEVNVRMPIKTDREGNKITKVCVEDVYKLVNKVYNNSVDILESIHKEVEDYEGELIIGTGTSQPCMTDAFDEEIGNNIAFMKAKLNANIKKHNFLCRVYNQYLHALENLDELIENVDEKIKMDLEGVRKHNPDYLYNLETKLGIIE